ncbi:MAG: hypothetical protein RR824_10935 [Clostridia bacterium]
MKKILSLILSMMMLVFSSIALAEQPNVITYDEATLQASGLEGEFVKLEDFGLQFFLPNGLQAVEATAEQTAAGTYAIYANADQTNMMSIGYAATMDAEGKPITELAALGEFYTANGATDVAMVELNGMACLEYTLTSANSMGIVFMMDSGNVLAFNFSPINDENFATVAAVIGTTVMPISAE